jgi:hypothetical protein
MPSYKRFFIFFLFCFVPMIACASPQFGGEQTSKSGSNRSSFSVRYDQLGLAIGDVLVVSVATDYSNARSVIVQGNGHPGSVTVYNADSTTSGQPRLRVDVLVYDGSWPSTLDYRFSVSDSETWIAYASKWSGVDPGNPVAAAAGNYDGVTANPVSPVLTAAEDGLTAVAIYGAREDDFDSNGTPAGYTPIGIGASNIGKTGSSSGIAYQAGITSGSFPAAMWTQAAATQAHAVHLLLRGANGGGTVPTAAAPTFTPAGGTVTDSVTVALSSATSTASIYYTTDNSTPTRSSTFYGGPFTLTSSATVRTIAVADGFNDSAVTSETFTVTAIDAGENPQGDAVQSGSPQYGGVQTSKSGVNRGSFSVRYDQLGLAIGDVLVVSVATDYSNARSVIVQGNGHPGGVTVYNADSTASGQPRLRVDVLVYDGSWPSTLDYRFSVSDSETWIAYASKWSGVDPGKPVAAAAGNYNGLTANPAPPALATPENGLTAVAIYGAREDDFDSNGTPAGYTPIGIGASNIGTTGSSSGIAYQAGISGGSLPAAIWTQAAATQAHAVHLLLRSGNGGGTNGVSTASIQAGGTLTQSGPIIIQSESDVVISGLHITNPKGSCIDISKGASNIIIENSEIGPCGGKGIDILNSSHITIRNNYIHDAVAEGIKSYGSHDIAVDSNVIEDIKSAYAMWTTRDGNLTFTNNFVKNVHRASANGGNMVTIAHVHARGIRVTDNIAVNILGQSNPEDLINVYSSDGTPDDPIQIKRNKFNGGGPRLSSGGIILGDQGGSYQIAEDNILVNPGQYGLQIGGGHHHTFRNNLVYSDDQRSFTNVGVIIWRYGSGTAPGGCHSNTVALNEITWWRGPNYKNQGNDPWLYPYYNPGFGADKIAPNCGNIAGWSTNKFDSKNSQPANLDISIWNPAWNTP